MHFRQMVTASTIHGSSPVFQLTREQPWMCSIDMVSLFFIQKIITKRGMELLMVNPFPWELITISLMQKTMKKKWQVLLPYLSNA